MGQQPQQQEQGQQQQQQQQPAEAALVTVAAQENAGVTASSEVAAASMPPVDPAFEASWAAYEQDAAALEVVLGGVNAEAKPISHTLVLAEADEAQVARDVVGIRFAAGQVSSHLPPVPADKMLLPPLYELRVLTQPPKWPKRLPLANFKVWTLPAATSSAPADDLASAMHQAESSDAGGGVSSRPLSGLSKLGTAEGASPSPRGKNTPRGKSASTAAASSRPPSAPTQPAQPEEEATRRGLKEATRWVIPPHGSVSLLVQFASDSVGKFSEVLGFDVLCGERNQKVVLTGACDYPRISTEARNLYYKIAKARPSTPNVKQQFMLPSNVFEFGPVLAGRDRSAAPEGHPDHTAKFRITNNGLFPLHADLWLKSEGPAADPTAAAAGVEVKKKAAAPAGKPGAGSKAPAAPPFLLQPSSMDLAIDETQELTVLAYPGAEGTFEDVVMCRLRDNPTPLEFPVSVIGAKPSVAIRLDQPVGAAPLGDAAKPGARERRTSEVGAKAAKPAAGKGAKQAVELTVQFDRLLLRKKDTQSIIISNTGVLPFKWRLAGAEKLPPEFRVYPAGGELAARSDVRVCVEFNALTKRELSELVTLEVLDVQEALGVNKSMPIAIRGEAHDIHVDIRFPQDNLAGVDFGPLRVVDDCVKQLVLKNTEKYEVQFEFAVRSEHVKQLVHISPESGVVPPNKEVPITLHWNKDLFLRQEVTLFGNTDILLCLIEPTTDSKEQQVPIKLSAHAQFSHYAITPARGLHFGPNTYNTLSKPRCFEVVNLGAFPFTMRVFDMFAKQNAEAAALKALAEEAAAKAAAIAGKTPGRKAATGASAAAALAAVVLPPPPPGTLQLGQFTVDPPEAVVQPGCRQEVSVVFRAEGNCSWSATAGLDISERDFVDAPEGIHYELGGESCIPGIDASNIGSIFEEHVVLSNLDPFKPINCSFGLRDKVFNFGTVIAQLDAADAAPASLDGSSAAGSKGEKKPAKAASKGAARASVSGPSSTAGSTAGAAAASVMEEPGAVKANLKFINPIKVPCTVNFSIKPRGGVQPGVRFPMEVFPSSIVIPPHEYRHVTLAFCPKAIQQYSATFEATVVGGGADPGTAGFVCELRGEGTLPSLSFQEPSTLDAAGRPVLKFGKLLAGRSSQLLVNVRNNGLLPASARIEMDDHPAFALLEGPQVFTVESKKAATFTVAFNPPEVGTFSHELQLRVKLNPFEQYKVVVTGECIQEDITFAGLPSDTLGVLNLPDVYLVSAPVTPGSGTRNARMSQTDAAQPAGSAAAAAASTSSYTFSLVNNSSTRHFRFKWPEHPQLKFTPSVGHLHAGASKDITVVLSAAVPVKLDGQDIKMAVSQISYKGEPIDWDDVLAASMIAAGARASSATRGSTGLPGSGPKPGAEPYVDLVAKTQRDVLLKVYATADSPRYECSAPAPAIVFRPTMMFQTRSFTFSITNSALTALKYQWMVLDKHGNLDKSGLYTLTPEAGMMSGGGSQQFTLRFSPQEVEDVSRTIMCHMPVLEQLAATASGAAADAFKQLTREVTGKVLRPWCHFELPDSDYLPAGRRNPELPGPSGVVEPLDPATKVLEFDSLGVRVRNTKQFFILNPTSISYDFVWAPVLPPAVAALGGPPPASPFNCLVRKGTISGGRRYEMVFEFTPTSDVLCESFWSFSIPSQGICVPFLLVGHVLEPRISLDRPAINFGQVQLGVRGKIKFTLNNDEHLPFTFALDKTSYGASDALLAASGGKALLDIQSAAGTVPANSKIELCAVFAPQAERPINYNVAVRVRNKPTPLVLNVKGEGYALQPSLLLELPDDSSLEMSPSGTNNLDYGQVVINDRVVKSLALINSGRVNFDFVWELGSNASLSVKPQAGSVPKGERRVVEISYAPTTQEHLAGYPISCQIINGPKYQLVLSGSGYKPKLHFSFLSHNFGPCHVWQQGMTPSSVSLMVQNQDKQAVGIDVLFDSNDNWQVMSTSCMLAPGQSTEVPVTFKPTAAQEYAAVMPLRVNGLYNINIMLAGEGVPLRVELAKPEQLQRGVSFGAVPCGSSCSRTLALANRGKAAAFVSFEPSMELFERLQVEVMPAGGMLLKPHEVAEVTLWYRPKQRMLAFKEPLHALVAGVPQVLATLTGASTGMALLLASDSIPFGTVVLGSRTTKRLQLSNHGDLGCRFAWDVRPLGQQFSISPADGFLAPGQDVKLEVAFHPTAVNADIRVERVHCRLLNSAPAGSGGSAAELAGAAAASSDLLLTLTGVCVQSEAAGELSFKCNVRTSTSKSITLSNSSSTNWQLRPAIQNEFWSGPEFLQVPAGGSAEYTLVYKPLTMTPAEGQPHEGSVFFPIPDGSGLLYKLYGQSDQPTPEAVVELSLPAKTQHSQTLRVSNWLHKPQRFKVIKELLVGEASTRLEGPTAIDVPALTDRDYKLSVYSYTTGLTHARITFKNEATGEYTFYELKLTSSAPAPMGQLVMECPCFSKTSTTISITNPLATQVPLKFSCTSKQVSLSQEPPVLAAGSTTPLEVRFRPLLVGASEAVLCLDSPELGLYEWRLRLTGAPTNPGRSLAFGVPLGTRDTQVFRFTHWLPEKTDYKCSFKSSGSTTSGGNLLSSSGFDVPVTVTAPAAGPTGVEVECVVGFEPCAVGEVFRDVLLLSSAAAGPYEVPLVGQCVPPKPQGPVDVSKGSAAVPFRNVFASEAEFFYSVDNPAFVVAKPSEKLQPKKPVTITVNYKPDAAAKAAATAEASSSPLACVRMHSRVLALAWLPPAEQQQDLRGNALLAVLHEFSPNSQPPVLHVDCLALDWQAGTASPGPWSLRNVHPSSRLLQAFPGCGGLPQGTLLISSQGVLLCSCAPAAAAAASDAAGSSAAAAAATPGSLAVRKLQLLQWQLAGVPLSCVALPGSSSYVVGDDRAGLYLLRLPDTSGAVATWQPITATCALAIPDVLCYAPFDSSSSRSLPVTEAEEQEGPQLAGLLFVGSKSSSSQVLGWPCTAGQQQQLTCPVLQSAFMPSLAGAQAVLALQDASGGLPEQQLLVACGAAPRGKLAVLRSGAGLTPFMLDGPTLPGDAVLFPIAEQPACDHSQPGAQQQQQQQQQHSLLGFSFPSAGVSEVLSLAGPTFRQLGLPGLQQGAASLLMAGAPGGWLLQVTAAGVWVLGRQPDRQLVHSWSPPGAAISLAAACGSHVVLACGSSVTCLSISCCSGQLQQVAACELQQQASALALLRLTGGQLVVAVGLWVDNSLLLMPWPSSSQQQQQQLLVAGMDIDSAAPSPAAAAAQQPQQQQGRVHVRELTTAKAFAGGLVTGLACSGPCLVATESLGSVTVLRALTTPGGRVQLLPVGADRHGLMAVDVALPVAPNRAAVGRTEEAAVQQAAAAGVQPAHESLLVATHPTGLLLLQRDLAAEAQHLAGAHQAAVAAWEAGGAARQAVLFGQAADAQLLWLQQQEQLQAVQPLLWLGQGEAAPWAAAGGPGAPGAAAAARPDGGPHHAAAAGGANRAGLAAAAAAAGGLAAPAAARPVTTGREVGVYNPGADMAPRLMSSAACAPAPGISLMATAQLGLHVQQLDRGEAGCSNGSSSGGAEPAVASSLPVWCFSASGAVSVAQMLQPQQARALLQLQKRLLEQQHGQPIPPPRKDCTPGYHPCNVDTANMTVGHIGASTLHLLTSLKAHEDAEKVALGMGPAGNTGTDNAENFDPNLDLTKVGPRTGRKMLAASDVAAA
ncbi:hypothetical protein OEZ85_007028 [Tetradesmus obliquus]|uniref:HYDIN/VesB/CFA65-like Ig-like domain-containing protein n=1 Tax=Tetradesmus obliquus TaxID=3088 RepID=A0ABY8TYI9_TETOB|nr:hypothetical protein OEZ85_007028 [Tetradesmus obliquus]